MTDPDILKWGKALLVKIHVITGWTIPKQTELMNILVDQFTKKIIEQFGSLNPDEIEFAFRKYGTVIQDWGKEMNLNLIDQVLIPYINERFKISAIEQQLKAEKPKQKIFTEAENDDAAREAAEAQFQRFVRGYELKGSEINKKILLKDQLIGKNETVIEYFTRRVKAGAKNIYVKQ